MEKHISIRRVRQSAHVIGGAMLSYYGISMVLSLAFFLTLFFVKGRLLQQGLDTSTYLEGTVSGLLLSIFLYLIPLLPPYLIIAHVRGFTFRDLLGHGKAPFSVYFICFGLCLVISMVASIVTAVLGTFFTYLLGVTEAASVYIMPQTAGAAVVQFFYIAIIPPFVEEICFRGFVFKESSRTAGTIGAAVISALVFAVSHEQFSVIPLAIMFGFFAACVRAKYDTVLPAMVGHGVVNGLYFFINFRTYYMNDNQYTAFAGAVNGLSLILGAIAVFLLFKRSHFSIEEMFSFCCPACCSGEKTTFAYLTSVPFMAAIVLLLGTAVYYLS